MRCAKICRNTLETKIELELNLDGSGNYDISTGIGFFDHMLSQLSKHSKIDIKLKAEGDLNVDSHHLIEDVGIVLGCALKEALGAIPVERYGESITAMDEALFICAVDLCGRSNFSIDDNMFTVEKLGEMDTEMIKEFFKALTSNGMFNLHIVKLRGENNHHIAEGMFKGFARALKKAIVLSDNLNTTKGVI